MGQLYMENEFIKRVNSNLQNQLSELKKSEVTSMLHDAITSEHKKLGISLACAALGASKARYIEQFKQALTTREKDALLQHL
jgi:hypothetical protein